MNRARSVSVSCMLGCLLVAVAAEAQPGQPVMNFQFEVDEGAVTLSWQKETGLTFHGATVYASYSPGGPIIAQQYVPPVFGDGVENPSVRYPVVPPGTYYVIVLVGAVPPTPALDSAWTRIDVGAGCTSPPNPPAFWDADDGDPASVDLRWAENEEGCPAEWFVMEAGTSPGASNLAIFTVHGSSFTAYPPAGTYYLRLRAANRFGGSTPSEEIVLAIEGCSPPGPPINFGATVTGSTVHLSWQPSALGAHTLIGYSLVAAALPGPSPPVRVDFPMHITSFTVPNVPSGSYSVLLVPLSSCPQGVGVPTLPLTVVVP